MKVKNNLFQNFNYLTSTSTFKIFILLMILMNLYVSSCTTVNLLYFESIVRILYYPYYHIVFFLLIFSIIVKSYQGIKENLFQSIRYQDYSTCMRHILKQIIFNISICFIINLLFLLASLNLFHLFSFDLINRVNGINILIYCIFILCRFYIFCIIFSILNFILLSLLNFKLTLLINILEILTIPHFFFLFPSVSLSTTDQIPIFYLGFFSNLTFSNFSVELCASVGHIFVLSVLCYILYNYIIYKSKIDFEISNILSK